MTTLFERIMKHAEAKREMTPICPFAGLHLGKRARSTEHAPAVRSGRLMRIRHGTYVRPNRVLDFGGPWVGLLHGPRWQLPAHHRASGEATGILLHREGLRALARCPLCHAPVFETSRLAEWTSRRTTLPAFPPTVIQLIRCCDGRSEPWKESSPATPRLTPPDIVAENLSRLRALFPEAFAEGKVNFNVLRQLLGDVVDATDEPYGLNWHGKRRARHLALTLSTGTLRPCPEESVDWDTTEHLIIEGDNLEVLKLLQKSYSRRIRTIYIDPPYNTGNNLIYPNDYSDGVRAYLEVTGQSTGQTKLTTNPTTGGRFHANWLSMIYPRLVLARNLLSPNGVLICTIDDNEVNQLGLILREVFEEGNFDHVCVPIVHNPRGVQGKNFSYVHEYAFFVYPRGTKAIADRLIPEEDVSWSQFRNWGTESKRQDAKNCFYPVLVKDGLIAGFGQVCDDSFHPHQTEVHAGVAYVYPIDGAGMERKWRYARQSVEAIQNLLRARKTKRGYEIEIGKNFGLYKTVVE